MSPPAARTRSSSASIARRVSVSEAGGGRARPDRPRRTAAPVCCQSNRIGSTVGRRRHEVVGPRVAMAQRWSCSAWKRSARAGRWTGPQLDGTPTRWLADRAGPRTIVESRQPPGPAFERIGRGQPGDGVAAHRQPGQPGTRSGRPRPDGTGPADVGHGDGNRLVRGHRPGRRPDAPVTEVLQEERTGGVRPLGRHVTDPAVRVGQRSRRPGCPGIGHGLPVVGTGFPAAARAVGSARDRQLGHHRRRSAPRLARRPGDPDRQIQRSPHHDAEGTSTTG